MLSLLLTIAISIELPRYQLDNSFIKVLDDSTMRDAVKKEKSSFVFFHSDHTRMSDVAYGQYLKVANKFKKNSTFFVVPASLGSDVMRSYSIVGTPSLVHFRLGTKVGTHFGLFSYDSINRFVANWTRPMMTQIQFKENVDEETVFAGLQQLYPDSRLVVAVFGDKSSKYGRCMFELADELGVFFPFVNIQDPQIAKALKLRNPSLVILRFEDSQRFEYNGEPDVDDMFIWIQHYSIPQFRSLDMKELFSPDGVAVRSAIAFLDSNNADQINDVYPAIGKYSSQQRWIRFYYADQHDFASLVNLFHIEKFPSILYLSANYTHCSYAVADVNDNATFNAFFEENLTLKTIPTPSGMYGVLRPVTEFAFEKMSDEGPFFTLFTSAFCAKCKTLKTAAIDAAMTIYRHHGRINWAFWDVTQATPSFQTNISLGIPSVWYFPSKNLSLGSPYAGPPNYLSIIEWANGFAPDSFDLDEIMKQELGGGFDDI